MQEGRWQEALVSQQHSTALKVDCHGASADSCCVRWVLQCITVTYAAKATPQYSLLSAALAVSWQHFSHPSTCLQLNSHMQPPLNGRMPRRLPLLRCASSKERYAPLGEISQPSPGGTDLEMVGAMCRQLDLMLYLTTPPWRSQCSPQTMQVCSHPTATACVTACSLPRRCLDPSSCFLVRGYR